MRKIITAWPYLIAVLFSLTPLVWFAGRGNVLIDGVDTNFPLNPAVWFERRFFVWNAISNAGSDFSSSTAGLFFHFIQTFPFKLGFNLQQVEIISLTFWFAVIVTAALLLAKRLFPGKASIQILFVSLYAFNIYLFNTWENVKVANLSLVAAIPLGLAILIALRDNLITFPRAFFYSVIVGIILSGSGINPAYFFIFFFLLSFYLLAEILTDFQRDIILRRISEFILVSLAVVLVNLFWILPTSHFILNNITPGGSIDKIGFTNWVDSLSENTSLLNVMRFQGAWDWYSIDHTIEAPLYIPYATKYFYKFPFIIFSFFILALTIFSLIFKSKKKNSLYLSFILMLLTGVFLDAGTHLPTGTIFRWFLNYLPFFTLFRSPWYIFTPLVILSLAGLVSLLFAQLSEEAGKISKPWNKFLVPLVVSVLTFANLIYVYPLIQGDIFRPGRPDSFYTNFPSYLFNTKNLTGLEGGRIVSYPDDEIERFSWGYRGVESILELIVDNEILFTPLNAPDSPIAKVLKEFYLSLKKGQTDAAENIALKLNIISIFEKNDQISLSPPLQVDTTGRPLYSVGQWNFYQFPKDAFLPKIYSPSKPFFGYTDTNQAKFLSVLSQDEVLVSPKDSLVGNLSGVLKEPGNIILAQNSQNNDLKDFIELPSTLSNRLLSRDMSKVDFIFDVSDDGIYQPVLERYHLEDFGIDLAKSLGVESDHSKVSWEIDKISGTYVYFKPLQFTKGSHKITLILNNKNLIKGGDFEKKIDLETEGDGNFEISEEPSNRYLNILNKSDRDISARFLVSPFDPMSAYVINIKYKQIYGNNANILIGQNNDNTLVKAQVERLPNYPEWNPFSFYFEPVQTASGMKIALISPFTKDPLGTKIFYDNVTVNKVFTNSLMLVRPGGKELSSPQITFKKVSPSQYEGKVDGGNNPHIIVFSENYSPEWGLSLFSDNGAKIAYSPTHFSANVYANAWYLDKMPLSYKFEIYYKPQRLFSVGLVISFAVFIFSVFGILFLVVKSLMRSKQ